MKFRTCLLLSFMALALVSNGILLFFLYQQGRTQVLEQMKSSILSIAETAALRIDGDVLNQLQTPDDAFTDNFRKIQLELRRIRDANRRPDFYVKFIYTMRAGKNGGDPVFVVDAEENPADVSKLGEPYESKNPEFVFTQKKATVEKDFIRDNWGLWLTGSAPIYGRNYQSVGVVGVDVDASEVVKKLHLLLYGGLAALSGSLVIAYLLAQTLSRQLNRPLAQINQALRAIGQGDLTTELSGTRQDEFGEVARSINLMTEGLRQRQQLKSTLVRYVSEQVAQEILDSGKLPQLQGEKRKITAMFADLRGFTRISDQANPEQVVQLLNEYFDRMIDAIYQHKGSLNKFMGDGLLAIFGAPVDDPEQEINACLAALEMQKATQELSIKWQREHGIPLNIGIGVSTGLAVVGNIGSEKRMEYTAIGDVVNLASRLESATKECGVSSLLSETTYQGAVDRFTFQSLGALKIRGKIQEISAYALIGFR